MVTGKIRLLKKRREQSDALLLRNSQKGSRSENGEDGKSTIPAIIEYPTCRGIKPLPSKGYLCLAKIL
jgi:hypothetical protein